MLLRGMHYLTASIVLIVIIELAMISISVGAIRLSRAEFERALRMANTSDPELVDIPMSKCAEAGRYCSIHAKCIKHPYYEVPICKCPKFPCFDQKELVCGVDAKTYLNLCSLKVTSCHDSANITMSYSGRCVSPVMLRKRRVPINRQALINVPFTPRIG